VQDLSHIAEETNQSIWINGLHEMMIETPFRPAPFSVGRTFAGHRQQHHLDVVLRRFHRLDHPA
jgi:hypothetical protein